MHILHID